MRYIPIKCWCISALIFCFTAQAGCAATPRNARKPSGPTTPARVSLITRTLEHDKLTRTYYVHLPPGFAKTKKAPLVIALHGGGGTGIGFERSVSGREFYRKGDKAGIVMVFPEGTNRQWNDGRKEPLRGKTPADDLGFISKLIDAMIRDYGIDPARVYATGISNGGFMSYRLAMDLSDKIAAVAPVTAQISKAIEKKIPAHPISVMVINGEADPIVPYHGGHVRLAKRGRSRGEILSTDATVERFRKHNGCSKTGVTRKLPDKDPKDGTRAEMTTWSGGRNGTEVVLIKIVGGGHTWPGGKQYLRERLVGKVCRDFHAGHQIIDFFLRHSRTSRRVE